MKLDNLSQFVNSIQLNQLFITVVFIRAINKNDTKEK